jgi:hypothetical protein
MYLDTDTYLLYPSADSVPAGSAHVIQLSPSLKNYHDVYMKCVDTWSVRNFQFLQRNFAPDEFFFDTFGLFGSASGGLSFEDYSDFVVLMLKELRTRAEAENVLYLEIMLTGTTGVRVDDSNRTANARMEDCVAKRDEASFSALLEQLYAEWETDSATQGDIKTFSDFVTAVDAASKTTAPGVTAYYQTYASRNSDVLRVYSQLYKGFKACMQNPLLVGVNIVSAENGERSLRDYWGHMRIFRFLKSKMPEVNTSLHAGELRLGLVPPEELQNHIGDAVTVAGASRIGHGVDIAFEKDAARTLEIMAANKILVEINLSSNEFILGIKESEHPLMLYHEKGVPIVLSTDDAGVLRTNLSEQYALAALRYPSLTYEDFKQFSFNSIAYAFLPDAEKQKITTELTRRFAEFEAQWNL